MDTVQIPMIIWSHALLRFGKNCKGDILHNYSPHDDWATVSRGAMLFATIFGFPINFTGDCSRDFGMYDQFIIFFFSSPKPEKQTLLQDKPWQAQHLLIFGNSILRSAGPGSCFFLMPAGLRTAFLALFGFGSRRRTWVSVTGPWLRLPGKISVSNSSRFRTTPNNSFQIDLETHVYIYIYLNG